MGLFGLGKKKEVESTSEDVIELESGGWEKIGSYSQCGDNPHLGTVVVSFKGHIPGWLRRYLKKYGVRGETHWITSHFRYFRLNTSMNDDYGIIFRKRSSTSNPIHSQKIKTEYTVVRHRGTLGSADRISIPEINFNCVVPSPSGKYKMMEFPCHQCCNITLQFVIETKKGNILFNHGIKYLSFFCTECGYRLESSNSDWEKLKKMDLYRTSLELIKKLDFETREKWLVNLKKKYE